VSFTLHPSTPRALLACKGAGSSAANIPGHAHPMASAPRGAAPRACRGEGSFGILTGGSCGFTNSDNSLPFPRDAVAAASDGSDQYVGSCGRCYAVRCRTGLVQGAWGQAASRAPRRRAQPQQPACIHAC
jgi:hypothetical protein